MKIIYFIYKGKKVKESEIAIFRSEASCLLFFSPSVHVPWLYDKNCTLF